MPTRSRELLIRIIFGAVLCLLVPASFYESAQAGTQHDVWLVAPMSLAWIGSLTLAVVSVIRMRSLEVSKALALVDIAISAISLLCAFALAYMECSSVDEHAFNIGKPLSVISAIYFTIVTFATVGYGDIYPTSDLTKLLVSGEILTAVFYAAFVLSVAAGFVVGPHRNPPT